MRNPIALSTPMVCRLPSVDAEMPKRGARRIANASYLVLERSQTHLPEANREELGESISTRMVRLCAAVNRDEAMALQALSTRQPISRNSNNQSCAFIVLITPYSNKNSSLSRCSVNWPSCPSAIIIPIDQTEPKFTSPTAMGWQNNDACSPLS